MILLCNSHAYENPLNSILITIFAKLITNVIKNEEYFLKDMLQ